MTVYSFTSLESPNGVRIIRVQSFCHFCHNTFLLFACNFGLSALSVSHFILCNVVNLYMEEIRVVDGSNKCRTLSLKTWDNLFS